MHCRPCLLPGKQCIPVWFGTWQAGPAHTGFAKMRECPDGCSVLGKQCTEPDLRVISAPARWERFPNPELTLRVSCAFFTKRYECISFFFQKVTMTYKTKSSFCIWPPSKHCYCFLEMAWSLIHAISCFTTLLSRPSVSYHIRCERGLKSLRSKGI